MREELLYFDMGKHLGVPAIPTEEIPRNRWKIVPYSTAKFDGTMVVAYGADNGLPDLELDPQLTGLYSIYIGVYHLLGIDGKCAVDVRLSDETFPIRIFSKAEASPWNINLHSVEINQDMYQEVPNAWCIDEVFWKTADMTGRKLIFQHPEEMLFTDKINSCIALVHFVPVEETVREDILQPTGNQQKHIFASDDMDNLFRQTPGDENLFLSRMEIFKNSGIGKVGLEYITHTLNLYKDTQDNLQRFYYDESAPYAALNDRYLTEKGMDAHKLMIDRGHELGLEMYISLRMGLWCDEYPVEDLFVNDFFEEHPHLRTIDRDGTVVSRLSYAFPEVQEHVIRLFEEMAEYECDGVDLLYNRGMPFILFEKPFIERVFKKYGVDACTLPLTDERIIQTKCEMMTEFMGALKDRLNKKRAFLGRKPLKIAVHVHRNIEVSRLIGLDVVSWIQKGLVDDVIFYPMEFFEKLPEVLMDSEGRVKVDRYRTFMREHASNFTWSVHKYMGLNWDVMEQDEEKIREMASLSQLGDVNIYMEIMPRTMLPGTLDALLNKLSSFGIENISLWDAANRHASRRQWLVTTQFGCKNKADYKTLYKNHQVLKIGKHVIDRYPPHWGT